jgi:hypothetical protein
LAVLEAGSLVGPSLFLEDITNRLSVLLYRVPGFGQEVGKKGNLVTRLQSNYLGFVGC